MRSTIITLSVLALSAPLAHAEEEHAHSGDVFLAIDSGRIVTGLFDDLDGFEPSRVFGVELGEIAPGASDEPGFDNAPGTFAPGTALGVNFRAALSIWTGAGLAPSSEAITFEFGPASMTTGAGPVPGFDIAVAPNGEWHEHYDMFLSDPLAVGAYVLELELFSTDPGVATSLPFWFVFNNGVSEAEHDAAIDYVQAVLVPAPGASALLLGGTLLAARRRRA